MNSPTDSRDQSDPGDEVIRKFRYQHAYGVVIAILAVNQTRPYRAIWCEQHEDLLAERNDDLFEAFQVKTRKPETGAWNISDEAFVKSIRRFIELDAAFPGKITAFHFVSNADFSDSEAKLNVHLSPVKLLKAVLESKAPSDLTGAPLKGFNLLRSLVECADAALFSVFQRIKLVHGPTERAFEDEICQTHLPSLDLCEGLSAGSLAKILNALIARMELASSLSSSNPLRHCASILASGDEDPYLHAKRVTANDIKLVIQDACYMGVQYPEELATLSLTPGRENRPVLKTKMDAGGLAANFEAMRRKALAAQYALIDLGTRAGDGKKLQAQLENVVLSECDEAYLRAKAQSSLFGSAMLLDLQEQLKRIATTESMKARGQPYEVLVGVAGLLSDDCKVWWSDQFPLEDTQ
jgi:hypothetical protein